MSKFVAYEVQIRFASECVCDEPVNDIKLTKVYVGTRLT